MRVRGNRRAQHKLLFLHAMQGRKAHAGVCSHPPLPPAQPKVYCDTTPPAATSPDGSSETDTMPKHGIQPADKHVGQRVRTRRLTLGLSQTKLGDALGLTFQQVQKYEKGKNRIGASRLQHISQILQVPVAFFFEGAPHARVQPHAKIDAPSPQYISDYLATSEGLQLTKAFMRIPNAKLRRSIVNLVEHIAGSEDH
jgi:transcriptional regulator with XRE-family HTH domain